MTKFLYSWLITVLFIGSCNTFKREDENNSKEVDINPAIYVNPFIGASTSTGKAGIYHGLGKTYPGAVTPYGMVQVSPNTITGGDNGSGYSYEHTSIEGFAFTQMSGVGWFGDLGNLLVTPTVGPLKTNAGSMEDTESGYRSKYDKESEEASAGYYKVFLSDYNIVAEMTAAPHSGILRFTYPKNTHSRIQIDLARRVGGTSVLQYVKVVDEHTIKGWMKCTPQGGGWGNGEGKADYTVYFYAQFSKPLKDFGVWRADIPEDWSRKRESVESKNYQQKIAESSVMEGVKEMKGEHLGFYSAFDTKEDEQVFFKSGISFVSMEGARHNLESEIPGWDFEQTRKQAFESWNKALSKMTVSGAKQDKAIFYTALYHTMIDPRIFTDVDGNYLSGNGQVNNTTLFTKRTIFSGWDVFRSQFPLQTLINPSLVNDVVNSLVTLADETGKEYLERWELLNAYSGCMIGNPAISVITDAYNKNIRGFDVDKAFEYVVNTSEKFGNGEKGYTWQPFGISNTLEYAYTEWCTALLAKKLGKDSIAGIYFKRAQSYRNIFDDSVGWFRPKKENGDWQPWPKEGRLQQWYGSIESNAYQQGWFVPHDIEGMVAMMGGKQKVVDDLTTFFEKMPENMMWNNYYNHANEPVHHVPFLFNYVGAPWLTQKWTREISKRAYHNSVEGLVGNEDVGQMSAWYVLASSGLYQVCPGKNRFDITSPVFDKIVIKLDPAYAKGEAFTITAHNNGPDNVYIQRASLNGKEYNKSFIDYKDIMGGGELELFMGEEPNYKFGVNR